MQPVLAALTLKKRGLQSAPGALPPPLVVSAVKTLLNDPDHLITTITVSQPVSSLEDSEAIATAVRRVAFEHHLAVEVSLRSGHVRARLSRVARQQEARDGEE